MTSRFAAVRVRPANRNLPKNPDGSLPECWLLIEWPPVATEPTDYWLSTLAEDTPIAELVRLGKIPLADRTASSNHPDAQLLPLLPTRRTHLTKYY